MCCIVEVSQNEFVLDIDFVFPHSLMIGKREDVIIFQEPLDKSDVLRASRELVLPNECRRVHVACHVNRSDAKVWNFVLEMKRLRKF